MIPLAVRTVVGDYKLLELGKDILDFETFFEVIMR